MNPISNIEVTINGTLQSMIDFKPETKEYDITVPEDCFGMLLRLKYEPEFYISITTDKAAGRYGYAELDTEMGDYIAGSEIPYYEYYDGYIVRLDKREACFEEDLKVDITVHASSAEHGEDEFKLHLLRKSGKETRALFQEKSFYDEEFQITMPYELYVPKKYNPKKKYPIVIGLHGTGEIQEPTAAVLQKMQMATIWAEDSENGHNECIVLAPQCTIRYNEEDNWTSLNQFIHGHSNSPFWPMPQLTVVWRLLESLQKEYNIDKKRIYLTGVSSGAFGAYVLAMEHPGAFAGLVMACGAANPERIKELKGTPLWIFHAEDDPLIVPAYTLAPTLQALDAAKIKYKLTTYPKGMIFWQSAHFCWEVVYKDKKMRDWLFSKGHAKEKKGQTNQDHTINADGAAIAAKAIAAAGGAAEIKNKKK
ncbi:MAG: dienelactone hydrolase family protein [Lachnospiraceae bacterium]|nr:dienelactone hydrolase family protein [Lachnospiraceae bacterium]